MAKTITVSDMDYEEYEKVRLEILSKHDPGATLTMPETVRIIFNQYKSRQALNNKPKAKL